MRVRHDKSSLKAVVEAAAGEGVEAVEVEVFANLSWGPQQVADFVEPQVRAARVPACSSLAQLHDRPRGHRTSISGTAHPKRRHQG